MSQAEKVAAVLGGARRKGAGWRCRCPIHGGHSLVVTDGRDGRLLVRCWGGGCDPRAILVALRRLRLLDEVVHHHAVAEVEVRSKKHDRDDTARRIELARRIWDAARDARGSPVVRYLAGRAITIPPPSSLRWAPRCWHREAGAHLPAMVALVEHVERGVVGAHRTYLTRDDSGIWCRRDRASLGPIAGGAVRLAPAGEPLMVSEGVETALSAMQATAQPAWAALSTSGLIALVLPPIVRQVIILTDHDCNGAGEFAARTAAARWIGEGRVVKIAMPPQVGTDFNDVLLGRTHARIEEVRDVAA
jgi:putative DNA primase/helicase